MTTNEPRREAGYRGALPTRDDRLARPWILTVIGIFVLVILLSIGGIPSRLIPEPTPIILTSLPPLPSAQPTREPTESPSPSASASGGASPSASPSPTP